MNNGERFEVVLNGLPYVKQINDIDFREENAVCFKWRGTTYRVSGACYVEEVGDGILVGSDKAILLRELLKKTMALKKVCPLGKKNKVVDVDIIIKSEIITEETVDSLFEPIISAINRYSKNRNIKIDTNEEESNLMKKRRKAAINFLREFYKGEDDLIDQYEIYTYLELLLSIKLAITTEKTRIDLQN